MQRAAIQSCKEILFIIKSSAVIGLIGNAVCWRLARWMRNNPAFCLFFKKKKNYYFIQTPGFYRWPAMGIHGDKSQQERDWVLNGDLEDTERMTASHGCCIAESLFLFPQSSDTAKLRSSLRPTWPPGV